MKPEIRVNQIILTKDTPPIIALPQATKDPIDKNKTDTLKALVVVPKVEP